MVTTTLNNTVAATDHAARTRALTVAGAVLAAVAVWAIAVPLLGTHLLVRFGTGAAQTVGLDYVVAGSLAASLLGWSVLVLLERRTRHARTIWTGAAGIVVVASLSLPIIAGTTMSATVALALMHAAVAAVLITALPRASAGPHAS